MTVQSEMTNAMLKAGVIEYADSEWSTGVVMAKKKGTTDKRYAVDCRGLGNVIGAPRIDNLLDHWGKANFFSTFDLALAFWSIPMRKSDKKYTAFHAYCDGGFQQYRSRSCHSAFSLVAVYSKRHSGDSYQGWISARCTSMTASVLPSQTISMCTCSS